MRGVATHYLELHMYDVLPNLLFGDFTHNNLDFLFSEDEKVLRLLAL